MDILAENQGEGGGQKTPIGPGTFFVSESSIIK